MKTKIEQVEEAYQRHGVDSFTFQARSNELRQMIRKYCKENGIEEVNNLR